MNKYIDRGSLFVAAITLSLFIAALFTKGLSHDLFLREDKSQDHSDAE